MALGNLIRMGFDTVCVPAGGIRIVLKTLGPCEEDLMVFSYGSPVPREVRLAYATLMLGHECVLEGRPGNLGAFVQFYASLPGTLVTRLTGALDELSLRSRMAAGLLLGYCFTAGSRRLWKVHGTHLGEPAVTGLSGTQLLGLNSVQEQWVALNKGLDEEAHDNDEMRRAIFVASAYNPKGVEKLSARMDTKERSKVEERSALLRFGSLANRDLVLGIVKKTSDDSWAPKLVTTGDMLRELEKQMSGYKDKHDLFVESYYKRKAAEAAEQAAREDAERREKFRKFDPDSVFQGQAAVSQEEMEAAMRGEIDIRELVAGRPRFGNVNKATVGHRVIR
jgi:hypothetical protein